MLICTKNVENSTMNVETSTINVETCGMSGMYDALFLLFSEI